MVQVIRGRADARRRALDAELDRLVPTLRELEGVEYAYVFGSIVAGGVHAGSDLDLLVARRTDEPFLARSQRLLAELAPRVTLDCFVYTPEEIAIGGRFIDFVVRSGRRLW